MNRYYELFDELYSETIYSDDTTEVTICPAQICLYRFLNPRQVILSQKDFRYVVNGVMNLLSSNECNWTIKKGVQLKSSSNVAVLTPLVELQMVEDFDFAQEIINKLSCIDSREEGCEICEDFNKDNKSCFAKIFPERINGIDGFVAKQENNILSIALFITEILSFY